jgi:Lrp/AsnC family transcriptional regulator, regulator for asnA, asnC and gidA
MSKFDKIDLQVINLLAEDGRVNAAEIARQLGHVTERTVRYRIERLLREGFIQICAVPNPRMLGFNVAADVFIEVEADQIFEVANKLAELECISYVACSIGEMDVSVQVLAKNTDEIYAFVTDVIRKIPGVRKTTTSIVPVVLKDIHKWRIPESDCQDIGQTITDE